MKLRRPGLISLFFLCAWLLTLLVAPAERTLGALIRWVYAHASITQVALIFFLVAAVLALLFLLRARPPHPTLYLWVEVIGWLALLLWLAGFLLSTIPAKLTWGVWVDFAEPRTQLTLRVLAVGALFLVLTRWLHSPRFTAIAQIALSAAILFLNRNTGVIRHPLNPMGEAATPAIPLSYGLIFLIALLGCGALAAYWVSARQKDALAQPLPRSTASPWS